MIQPHDLSKGQQRAGSATHPAPNRRVSAQRKLVLLGAAVLAALALLSQLVPAHNSSARHRGDEVGRRDSAPAPAEPAPEAAGPWGVLQVTDLWLEAPDALLAAIPTPNQRPLWRFSVTDVEALRSQLAGLGLSAAEVGALLTPETCTVEESRITLLPPTSLVLGLSAVARQALYEELARNPQNAFHQFPLVLPHDFARQLESTRLSAPQRAAMASLQWRNGELRVFSDIEMLVQLAATAEEIAEAKRVCSRATGVRVTVRVGDRTRPDDFVRYWGAGRKNLEPQSLVRAFAARQGGEAIDVALLLPPIGRERLYTFPGVGDAVAGRLPDCHWSALNFFSEAPRPYYLDSRPAYVLLTQDYETIEAPAELGDLVCILDARGDYIHSCVFVAGGVVFTKNGANLNAPWILQRLSETRAIYRARGGISARYLRLKSRLS
jgi:hypothetical protein